MYLDALDPDLASERRIQPPRGAHPGRAAPRRHHRRGRPRAGALHRRRGARHAAATIVAQAEALKDAGVRLIVVAEGRAEPARIPIRDSAGTLLEYKQDEDGHRGPDPAARRRPPARWWTRPRARWCPSEVPDQAGAVRDLVAAMKRSPTSETRTADLVPRAWIPVLGRGPAACALHPRSAGAGAGRPRRPPARRHRCGAAPDRGRRARWPPATRRAAARVPRRRRAGAARATPPSTMRAPRRWRPGGSMSRAARSPRRPSRSIPTLRYRALYNLGLVGLLAAEADTTRQEELLEDAVDRLRQALLLQPSSARAKWNLELADRRRPPPPSGGGGGGGGTPPPAGGGGQQPAAARREPPQPGPRRRARRSRSSTPWSGASARPAPSSSAGSRAGRPEE